jgi:hypothetical protein
MKTPFENRQYQSQKNAFYRFGGMNEKQPNKLIKKR